MKQVIWISYDLGVKGDYEGLYGWLDGHNLSRNVNLGKRDRVYIVWSENQKMKGQFLFGKRKSVPWAGFGSQEPQVDEEA